MKQTYREKDVADRLFLSKLLKAQGIPVDGTQGERARGFLKWLERIIGSGRR